MAVVVQGLVHRSPSCSALRLLPRAAGAGCGVRSLHSGRPHQAADKSYQFVVCGGGAGGLAVASWLGRRFGEGKLAVIEPSSVRKSAITCVCE